MRSRALAVLAAAVLLVGCGGDSRTAPDAETAPDSGTRPDQAVLEALRDVCSQPGLANPIGVTGAGTAIPGGHNHLVVLNSTGDESPWTGSPPDDWRPATLADTEFVACVSDNAPGESGTCRYTSGWTVNRVTYSTTVWVYEAATGREILFGGGPGFTLDGDPPPTCPQTNPATSELEGERIDWATVQSHLEGLVSGEAVGGVTLTLTGGPDAGSYSLPDPSCSFGLHEPGVWQVEALDQYVKEGLSYFLFIGYDGPGSTDFNYLVGDAKIASDVTIGPWLKGRTYSVLVAKTAEETVGEGAFSVDVRGETARFTFAGKDPSGVGIAWTVFCPRQERPL